MSFLAAIRVALAALLVNKGRSILTSLGIVIGISAVIAMVSAGSGARYKLDERLESVGKNLILIRPGARTQQGIVAESAPLTIEDAEAIRKHLGSLILGVAPSQTTQRLVSTRSAHHGTTLVGSTPDLQQVREWKTPYGRFYTSEEVERAAPVCLIGQTVRRKLFPDLPDPIGQLIKVGRLQIRVIGVLGDKGRDPRGIDQDDQIFVPITTLQRKLQAEEKAPASFMTPDSEGISANPLASGDEEGDPGAPTSRSAQDGQKELEKQFAAKDRIALIVTRARSDDVTEHVKEEVIKALREQHHLKPGAPDDFDVSTVQEMAELAVVLTTTMQILVAIIASISLVVGGIGIMNIMLVSVTERTREIGIRMAVGATGADVLIQFLMEAVALALVGGLIGITLGIGVAVGLARLAHWPVVVQPGIVALAFLVAAGVGIFFGYYPALKASQLDPIEALHYE